MSTKMKKTALKKGVLNKTKRTKKVECNDINIIRACMFGNLKVVKKFIKQGGNGNTKDE